MRVLALALSLLLLLSLVWARAVEVRPQSYSCPGGEAFSCATLARAALRSLGPLPIVHAASLGALCEALASLLLLARGAKRPFARDAAVLTALGSGFALGVQPLALLVAGGPCLLCLLALSSQLALSLVLASLGGARRPALAAFSLSLVLVGGFATRDGLLKRRRDQDSRERLERLERRGARLLLIERPRCPHCEALRLDVLSRPEILARLERTSLERREARAGESAPLLVARDRSGRELERASGFSEDASAYEAVLRAAER